MSSVEPVVEEEDMTGDERDETLDCLYRNEAGDARIFKTVNDGRFIYDHAAGLWYIWTDHYWQQDLRNEVLDEGCETVIDVYEKKAAQLSWCATNALRAGKEKVAERYEKRRKHLMARIKELNGVKRRRNMLTWVPQAKVDLRGRNGTGSLINWRAKMVLSIYKSGEIQPGVQQDFLKTACSIEYKGLNEPAPTFEQFLVSVFRKHPGRYRLFAAAIRVRLNRGLAVHHIFPIFWGGWSKW